ncbi:MAG: DUF5696 domain-containing protein [Oscillospiraceae bacterium]|nr:DUF5696 domain-containing protein [Oscillospiraceae bacterium]
MLCTAALSLSTFSAPLSGFAAEDAEEESGSSAVTADEEPWSERTPSDVFAKMKKAAENDKLEFWIWDADLCDSDNGDQPEDIFALVNKSNGYVWWSSPINAGGDAIATPVLKNELQSGLVLTAAQIHDRSTQNYRSGDSNKTVRTFSDIPNGVQVTYFFRKSGIKIPVSYVLKEDYLEVSVDTEKISEKHGPEDEKPVLTQALSILNAFGAADEQEEGYFVIPDGSGALIQFHNEKYAAKPYSQMIYGVDTTAVPKTKGAVTEGVSLPMYGICKGENALLAVAAEGDGNCAVCADISGTGQSNTEYNRCYFQFILRSSDQYFLGGDQQNPLDIYAKSIENHPLKVRYYPLSAADAVNQDKGEVLDYVDIAARYRQYLIEEQHVAPKAQKEDAQLYIDFYGGCMKQKNILGFPKFMKQCMTSYAEMETVLSDLQAAGADNLTVTLNQWNDDGISGKADYKTKASSTLGGTSAFRHLLQYMDSNQITWYPCVSNTAFYSGNGFLALNDTSVRVSGSFARIVDYERAYGVPYGKKKTMSLLSPSVFPQLFQKLSSNYQKAGFHSACIGELSSVLYGDYGKKSNTPREDTKKNITDGLQNLKENVGSILSSDPNAYVLPYTDTITNMPLYSSRFHIFDEDIPLYQMVMHGLVPYSTKAVNGSAAPEQLVLLALAAGSNLRFDMMYAETSELKDTDFDVYYYAYHAYWTKNAAQYYLFTKDILASVSDAAIISYQRTDDIITTKYDNGVTTVVSLSDGSVSWNGQTRRLKDYVKEGDA